MRVAWHVLAAVGVVLLSLAMGMAGFLCFEPDHVRTWRDAFLNASMFLSGMGRVHTPQTDGGKVFAGLHALFAGVVFITAAGIIVAPVLHRLLHLLDWDERGRTP